MQALFLTPSIEKKTQPEKNPELRLSGPKNYETCLTCPRSFILSVLVDQVVVAAVLVDFHSPTTHLPFGSDFAVSSGDGGSGDEAARTTLLAVASR